MKVGDLVRMKTHETGHVGIVVDKEPAGSDGYISPQIAIHWFGGQYNKVEWEPEAWLEVVNEGR
jgi:hypothetical protein